MQGEVGSFITTILQIYCRIVQWQNLENRLRFDRIMAWSRVWCTVFGLPAFYFAADSWPSFSDYVSLYGDFLLPYFSQLKKSQLLNWTKVRPVCTKYEAYSQSNREPDVADYVWVEENRTGDGLVLNNGCLCPIFTERSTVVVHRHVKVTACLQAEC